MRRIKKLPSNLIYLYTSVEPTFNDVCKVYRSRKSKTIYLAYTNVIFSFKPLDLVNLSEKFTSYVKQISKNKPVKKSSHSGRKVITSKPKRVSRAV